MPPAGISWMPTFSVVTSTAGLLSPFPEEGILGEARDLSGETHSTEAHLGQCPVITLGASPCSHGNNAAVICSGECWENAALTPFALCVQHDHPKQGSYGSTRLNFSLEKPLLPQEPSGGLCLLKLTALLWESRGLNGGRHLPPGQWLRPWHHGQAWAPVFFCCGMSPGQGCRALLHPSSCR